jgi:hypothetical protein
MMCLQVIEEMLLRAFLRNVFVVPTHPKSNLEFVIGSIHLLDNCISICKFLNI